jgi:hypothetical protein
MLQCSAVGYNLYNMEEWLANLHLVDQSISIRMSRYEIIVILNVRGVILQRGNESAPAGTYLYSWYYTEQKMWQKGENFSTSQTRSQSYKQRWGFWGAKRDINCQLLLSSHLLSKFILAYLNQSSTSSRANTAEDFLLYSEDFAKASCHHDIIYPGIIHH